MTKRDVSPHSIHRPSTMAEQDRDALAMMPHHHGALGPGELPLPDPVLQRQVIALQRVVGNAAVQ